MSAPKRMGAKTLAAAVGSLVWVFSSMAVSANPGHGVAASTDAERLATAVLKVGRYYEKDRRTHPHTRYYKRPHGRHTVEAPFRMWRRTAVVWSSMRPLLSLNGPAAVCACALHLSICIFLADRFFCDVY